MSVIITRDEIRSDVSEVFAVKRHPSRGKGWALSTRPAGDVLTRAQALAAVTAADEAEGGQEDDYNWAAVNAEIQR
jgi:hypothetical protein